MILFEDIDLSHDRKATIRTEITMGQAKAIKRLRKARIEGVFGADYKPPTSKDELEKLSDEEKDRAEDYTLEVILIQCAVGVESISGPSGTLVGEWPTRPRKAAEYALRMDFLEDNFSAEDLGALFSAISSRLEVTEKEEDALGKP